MAENQPDPPADTGLPANTHAVIALAPSGIRYVNARQLLGSDRELMIVHGSERYRLQATRLGKLILTK